MNILQMQDNLKGLPDNTLITYMQNPTSTMQGMIGQYPSYLVLGELQRRKDMRARYEANQTQNKPTVAEQVVEETKPGISQAQRMIVGGGIGNLQRDVNTSRVEDKGVPTLKSNVGKDNAFAAGGIVSFDGTEGSLVQGLQKEIYGAQDYRDEILKQIEELNKKYPQKGKEMSDAYVEMQENFKTPFDDAIKQYQEGTFASDVSQEAIDTKIAELQKNRDDFIKFSDPTTAQNMPKDKVDPITLFDKEPTVVAQKPDPIGSTDKININNKVASVGDKLPQGAYDDIFKFIDDQRRPEGEDVIDSARSKFQQMMGPDPVREQMMQRANKALERADKIGDEKLGRSAIAAGAAMLKNRDPFFEVGLGAGLEAGAKQYGELETKQQALEKAGMDSKSALNTAARSELAAANKYALESERYAQAANDKLNQLAVAGRFDIEKYKQAYGDKTTKSELAIRKQIDQIKTEFAKGGRKNINLDMSVEEYKAILDKRVKDKLINKKDSDRELSEFENYKARIAPLNALLFESLTAGNTGSLQPDYNPLVNRALTKLST